jgi:hypothetical protein
VFAANPLTSILFPEFTAITPVCPVLAIAVYDINPLPGATKLPPLQGGTFGYVNVTFAEVELVD